MAFCVLDMNKNNTLANFGLGLILMTAFALAGVAAYQSIVGLSDLFAARAEVVIVMAVFIEFAKLLLAGALHMFWREIPWWKWIGVSIIAIAVVFIRDTFALSFSLISGIAMIAIAVKANMFVNDAILRLIALTNMMYVPLDIYNDTIVRSDLRSDAFMLAEELGGSTVLWGSLWALISGVLVLMTLWLGIKGKKPIRLNE